MCQVQNNQQGIVSYKGLINLANVFENKEKKMCCLFSKRPDGVRRKQHDHHELQPSISSTEMGAHFIQAESNDTEVLSLVPYMQQNISNSLTGEYVAVRGANSLDCTPEQADSTASENTL